jgi:hypothetical protein
MVRSISHKILLGGIMEPQLGKKSTSFASKVSSASSISHACWILVKHSSCSVLFGDEINYNDHPLIVCYGATMPWASAQMDFVSCSWAAPSPFFKSGHPNEDALVVQQPAWSSRLMLRSQGAGKWPRRVNLIKLNWFPSVQLQEYIITKITTLRTVPVEGHGDNPLLSLHDILYSLS